MFGLLPIEGSWFLRFEKLLKEFFLKPHPFFIRIFRTTLSILRKSPRPSLPLKRAPPLTPTLSPSGEREETALLGARNRFALRLADHQRSRQIVWDGTALLLLACGLLRDLTTAWGWVGHQRSRQIVRDGTAWVLLACELVMDLVTTWGWVEHQRSRQIVCRLAHSMFLSRLCRYNGCRNTMTR